MATFPSTVWLISQPTFDCLLGMGVSMKQSPTKHHTPREAIKHYLVFVVERVTLSRLWSTGASGSGTPTVSITHTHQYWPLFVKRQKGNLTLHVGLANTQLSSAIFSPIPQGSG